MQTKEIKNSTNIQTETMPNKNDYDVFAPFYDAVMGDRSKVAQKITGFIQEFNPSAKSILELASGTGTNLVPFADSYEVSGLDLSEGMLRVAGEKLPGVNFYNQSMIDFTIGKKFDVVMCLFDSINHILDISQWKKMFENVKQHLADGGTFIFDVNTPEKLQRVVNEESGQRDFDGNTMVMTVTDEGNGVTNWNIKVFERKNGKEILHEDNIKEVAFPTEEISKVAREVFGTVEVRLDPVAKSGVVERVYFICKK